MKIYSRGIVATVIFAICSIALAGDVPLADVPQQQLVASEKKMATATFQILPTTEGDNSIVDAIKYYSNLTGADVNQWKLLWLGDFGSTFAAGILSGAGAFGVGRQVYNMMSDPSYPGRLKEVLPQAILPQSVKPPVKSSDWVESLASFVGSGMVPMRYRTTSQAAPQPKANLVENIIQPVMTTSQWFMTSPDIWSAIAFVGTGLLNLKMLYPRMSAGVRSKIRQFINVCESLKMAGKDKDKSIVNFKFANVDALKDNLPTGWASESDNAIYKGLNNLAYQAGCASKLLGAIGTDDIQDQLKAIDGYSLCLNHNKEKLGDIIDVAQKKQAEIDNQNADRKLKVEAAQADIGLKKAATTGINVSTAKSIGQSIWDAGSWVYKNKEYFLTTAIGAAAAAWYNDIASKWNKESLPK